LSSRYNGVLLRYLLMVVLAATALKLLGVPNVVAALVAAVGAVVVLLAMLRERREAQALVASAGPDG
jgi:hypothetical protein